MKVPIEADWKSPCTVLVSRAVAVTVPASCFDGGLSGMRSWKLVSTRLNAVVCEFAMFPEMFSSANDCARSPVTAVVSAPKIPIPSSDQASRTRCAAPHGRNIGKRYRKPRATRVCVKNQHVRETVRDDPSARKCLVRQDLPGKKGSGE